MLSNFIINEFQFTNGKREVLFEKAMHETNYFNLKKYVLQNVPI